MPAHANCPFRAAFLAVESVVDAVDPGLSPAEIVCEYGFSGGGRLLAARAAVAAGLAGDLTGYGQLFEALAGVAEFVESWSDYLLDCDDEERAGLVHAARAALAVARDPAVLAAADAGWFAACNALKPDAGPFPGAAVLAAGLCGPARDAFLSGFLARVPSGGLRLDPVSGAVTPLAA